MQGLVAGVDEAGRGPLAGPVVAAAAVLAGDQVVVGVRDSKKVAARKRQALAENIRAEAVGFFIAVASVSEIDELNILGATMLAMRRAIAGLHVVPDLVRIDGNRCPDLSGVYTGATETWVGGDDRCPAIAAASILAKVARDQIMDELHGEFPDYGFDSHRGYPTVAHRNALRRLGPTPVHRKSFRPVRDVLHLLPENAGAY